MRLYRAILLACVVSAAAGGVASAAERILLPYACGFEYGRLVLRPSATMKSYDVLGERVQKPIIDCNFTRGDECRSLMGHQFSIACKGMNVPWVKAVAAIRSNTGLRSWIYNNRLKIVFPSRNGARAACLDDTTRRDGVSKISSTCLPWRHADSGSAMTLDEGFAPVEEIGARLERVWGGSDTVTGSIGTGSTTGGLLIGASAARAAEVAGWVTTVDGRDLSEQASVAMFALVPQSTWFWPIMALLVISNGWFAWWKGLGGAVLDVYRNYRTHQLDTGPLRRGLDELAAHFARATKSESEKPADAPKSMGENLDNAASFVTAVLGDAKERVGRLNAGALRGVLEQELYVIGQRLNYTRTAATDGREAPAKAAGVFRALVREVERLRRIAESAETSAGRAARDGATLPRSRSEAFAVLGVNPDVSETIVKKLVDALRMSWHPDLAKDEADRIAREERIKQINVAWELVNGKREAA